MEESERLRQLFARYIAHVRACEGVDYIIDGHVLEEDAFTPAEWEELRILAESIKS